MTIARMQYEMIKNNPYKFTSDDVIFSIYVIKNEVSKNEFEKKGKGSFLWDRPAFDQRHLQSAMAGECIVIQKEKLLSMRWNQTSTRNSRKIETSRM